MVRTFASIMGLLGMSLILLRAMIHGSSMAGTAPKAIVGMLIFSVVGAIVGAIAKGVVDDSVQIQLKQEVAAMSDTATSSNAS